MKANVTTTVTMQVDHLNAEAIVAFADLLQRQEVRPTAPVTVQLHRGQRDQDEGATLTCLVVHG